MSFEKSLDSYFKIILDANGAFALLLRGLPVNSWVFMAVSTGILGTLILATIFDWIKYNHY